MVTVPYRMYVCICMYYMVYMGFICNIFLSVHVLTYYNYTIPHTWSWMEWMEWMDGWIPYVYTIHMYHGHLYIHMVINVGLRLSFVLLFVVGTFFFHSLFRSHHITQHSLIHSYTTYMIFIHQFLAFILIIHWWWIGSSRSEEAWSGGSTASTVTSTSSIINRCPCEEEATRTRSTRGTIIIIVLRISTRSTIVIAIIVGVIIITKW